MASFHEEDEASDDESPGSPSPVTKLLEGLAVVNDLSLGAMLQQIESEATDPNDDPKVRLTADFWGGALAGFGACLILWWVVDRHRRRR